jgi:hypothetical protein
MVTEAPNKPAKAAEVDPVDFRAVSVRHIHLGITAMTP